jgi:hypothetical protein
MIQRNAELAASNCMIMYTSNPLGVFNTLPLYIFHRIWFLMQLMQCNLKEEGSLFKNRGDPRMFMDSSTLKRTSKFIPPT